MVTLNLASALLLILHDCMSGLLQISLNHQQRSTMVFFSVLTHRKTVSAVEEGRAEKKKFVICADEISVEVVENKMGKSKIINREKKLKYEELLSSSVSSPFQVVFFFIHLIVRLWRLAVNWETKEIWKRRKWILIQNFHFLFYR